MNKPVKTSKMPEILKKAERALQIAVRKVWAEHRLRGLPVYVWQHNKVVRIPANRIPSR
jgi:hypothetical protein